MRSHANSSNMKIMGIDMEISKKKKQFWFSGVFTSMQKNQNAVAIATLSIRSQCLVTNVIFQDLLLLSYPSSVFIQKYGFFSVAGQDACSQVNLYCAYLKGRYRLQCISFIELCYKQWRTMHCYVPSVNSFRIGKQKISIQPKEIHWIFLIVIYRETIQGVVSHT